MPRRRNRRTDRRLRDRLPSPKALVATGRRGLAKAAPVLIASGIALVSAGGLWLGHRWLTGSDRFALDRIEVQGAPHLSSDDVARLAGLGPGTNVFRVDLAQVAADVERSPWVDQATVHRELPNTLRVDVVERAAAALVELDGLYLVDRDGRPVKRAVIASGDGDALPVVTGLSRAAYLRDEERARATIRDALAAYREYASGSHRPAIGEIHIHERRGVTLFTREDAIAIALGVGGDPARHDQRGLSQGPAQAPAHSPAHGPADKLAHRPAQGPARKLARRLAAFDAAWRALDDRERALASAVYINNATHPNRVIVGFRKAED